MTRRLPSSRLPAAGAVIVLLGAAGLSACGGPAVHGPIDPIVMTDGDGVLHGPDEGATPVSPPSPAPAGPDLVTGPPESGQEIRREPEPSIPPAPDDHPEPPPPPPDDGDEGEEDDGDDTPDVDDDSDDAPDVDDDSLDEADEADDD